MSDPPPAALWGDERYGGACVVLADGAPLGTAGGVLALMASRLGAAEAMGFDIEPPAVSAIDANASCNGFDKVTAFSTAAVGEAGLDKFDVVVADSTVDVLIALASEMIARVAPGGRLAISGISVAQTSSVASVYRRHGIEFARPARPDDWATPGP